METLKELTKPIDHATEPLPQRDPGHGGHQGTSGGERYPAEQV